MGAAYWKAGLNESDFLGLDIDDVLEDLDVVPVADPLDWWQLVVSPEAIDAWRAKSVAFSRAEPGAPESPPLPTRAPRRKRRRTRRRKDRREYPSLKAVTVCQPSEYAAPFISDEERATRALDISEAQFLQRPRTVDYKKLPGDHYELTCRLCEWTEVIHKPSQPPTMEAMMHMSHCRVAE